MDTSKEGRGTEYDADIHPTQVAKTNGSISAFYFTCQFHSKLPFALRLETKKSCVLFPESRRPPSPPTTIEPSSPIAIANSSSSVDGKFWQTGGRGVNELAFGYRYKLIAGL